MSASPPDRARPALLLALALAVLPALLPVQAAAPGDAEILLEGDNPSGNLDAGNFALRAISLKQGSTLITADEGAATSTGRNIANSRWEFKGKVHVEHAGVILDADGATAVLQGGRLQSVQVRGKPSRFSHQTGSEQRNLGRANAIDYDAVSGEVRFTGDAWYSNGRNYEVSTDTVLYNVNDGSVTDNSKDGTRFRMTIRPEKRVPPPRAPERSSAP